MLNQRQSLDIPRCINAESTSITEYTALYQCWINVNHWTHGAESMLHQCWINGNHWTHDVISMLYQRQSLNTRRSINVKSTLVTEYTPLYQCWINGNHWIHVLYHCWLNVESTTINEYTALSQFWINVESTSITEHTALYQRQGRWLNTVFSGDYQLIFWYNLVEKLWIDFATSNQPGPSL